MLSHHQCILVTIHHHNQLNSQNHNYVTTAHIIPISKPVFPPISEATRFQHNNGTLDNYHCCHGNAQIPESQSIRRPVHYPLQHQSQPGGVESQWNEQVTRLCWCSGVHQ